MCSNVQVSYTCIHKSLHFGQSGAVRRLRKEDHYFNGNPISKENKNDRTEVNKKSLLSI